MTYWILIVFQALCWVFYMYYFSLLYDSVMYMLTLSSFYTGTNRLKAIAYGHMASSCQSWNLNRKFGLNCSASRLPRRGLRLLSIHSPSALKPPPQNTCLYSTAPWACFVSDRLKEKNNHEEKWMKKRQCWLNSQGDKNSDFQESTSYKWSILKILIWELWSHFRLLTFLLES